MILYSRQYAVKSANTKANEKKRTDTDLPIYGMITTTGCYVSIIVGKHNLRPIPRKKEAIFPV